MTFSALGWRDRIAVIAGATSAFFGALMFLIPFVSTAGTGRPSMVVEKGSDASSTSRAACGGWVMVLPALKAQRTLRASVGYFKSWGNKRP